MDCMGCAGCWQQQCQVLTLEEVLVHLPAVLLRDQHLDWWVGVLKRVGSRPTRLPCGVCSKAAQQQPVR